MQTSIKTCPPAPRKPFNSFRVDRSQTDYVPTSLFEDPKSVVITLNYSSYGFLEKGMWHHVQGLCHLCIDETNPFRYHCRAAHYHGSLKQLPIEGKGITKCEMLSCFIVKDYALGNFINHLRANGCTLIQFR